MNNTTRRKALITGGSQGIGLGIAQSLAREGLDLAIAGRKDEEACRQALEDLRAHGVQVIYCQADVSSPEDRRKMLEKIDENFGQLHVLVNNAGVAPNVRLDILETSEESFERLMRINLQGPFFLTQSVANWMIAQKQKNPDFSGCIINVSSISATAASTGRGEYCISKAGMAMSTKLFAVRLAELDIPVYEIQPGIIETAMTAGVKEKYDRRIAEGLLPQARWGQPEDVGKAAAMMVRGDIPYSTGQVLRVDGGFHLEIL